MGLCILPPGPWSRQLQSLCLRQAGSLCSTTHQGFIRCKFFRNTIYGWLNISLFVNPEIFFKDNFIFHPFDKFSLFFFTITLKKTQQAGRDLSSPIIALGCGCCLVQSCLTLLLLSCRRAFLQLLKVQFCLAVSSFMAIFVHVTRVVPTEVTIQNNFNVF